MFILGGVMRAANSTWAAAEALRKGAKGVAAEKQSDCAEAVLRINPQFENREPRKEHCIIVNVIPRVRVGGDPEDRDRKEQHQV